MVSTPEPGRGGTSLKMGRQSLEDSLQQPDAQSTASFRVGSRAEGGTPQDARLGDEPGAHLAHDFLAGRRRIENLKEESPEQGDGRVDALAFGLSIRSFGKEVGGEQSAEQGSEIGQSQLTELTQARGDAGRLGGFSAALKMAWKVGEKVGEKVGRKQVRRAMNMQHRRAQNDAL